MLHPAFTGQPPAPSCRGSFQVASVTAPPARGARLSGCRARPGLVRPLSPPRVHKHNTLPIACPVVFQKKFHHTRCKASLTRFQDFIMKSLRLYQKAVIEALRPVCINASSIPQVVRNVKHFPPLLLHVQPTHQDTSYVTSSTSITSAARAINI